MGCNSPRVGHCEAECAKASDKSDTWSFGRAPAVTGTAAIIYQGSSLPFFDQQACTAVVVQAFFFGINENTFKGENKHSLSPSRAAQTRVLSATLAFSTKHLMRSVLPIRATEARSTIAMSFPIFSSPRPSSLTPYLSETTAIALTENTLRYFFARIKTTSLFPQIPQPQTQQEC